MHRFEDTDQNLKNQFSSFANIYQPMNFFSNVLWLSQQRNFFCNLTDFLSLTVYEIPMMSKIKDPMKSQFPENACGKPIRKKGFEEGRWRMKFERD